MFLFLSNCFYAFRTSNKLYFIHFNVTNFYRFRYRRVTFRAGFGIISRKIRFNEFTHCFQCKRPSLENKNFTRRRIGKLFSVLSIVNFLRYPTCFRGFTIFSKRGNFKPFPIQLLRYYTSFQLATSCSAIFQKLRYPSVTRYSPLCSRVVRRLVSMVFKVRVLKNLLVLYGEKLNNAIRVHCRF